ncbi:MAG: hypothetical protein RBT75_19125 [Anaerolineae bacterium]|nr:hypothetical protein [Anaerolineae bacterium]
MGFYDHVARQLDGGADAAWPWCASCKQIASSQAQQVGQAAVQQRWATIPAHA